MSKRRKDVDAAERVFKLKAMIWSVGVGVTMGGVAGAAAAYNAYGGGLAVILAYLLGASVVATVMYGLAVSITSGGGSIMGKIHNPSGSSTPPKRDYSRAKTHTVRGEYEQAAAVWQLYAVEYPTDPTPCIELARLYRNELHDYASAVSWYQKARETTKLDPGREIFITQEIVEIYTHKLQTPRKAIPELAGLIKKFPDDPSVAETRSMLERLREEIRKEQELA